MISWIQNLLLKRGRTVILLLLGVIIVAFVFTIGESPGIVTGERRVEERFFGVNLQDGQEVEQLFLRAQLSQYLQSGQFPRNPELLERDAVLRLALLDLADQLAMPNPSVDALREYVTTRPAFLGDDGVFDPVLYSDFLDMVETNPMIRQAMVERVLNEDYRRDRILDLITEPEVAIRHEALLSVKQTMTRFGAEVITLLLPEANEIAEPEAEALESFFAENARRYATPEERTFMLARFPAEAFTAGISLPDSRELRTWLQRNQELQATLRGEEELTLDELMETHAEAIATAWKETEARRRAGDTAHEFAFELWNRQSRPDFETFTRMAAEFGATTERVDPVTLRAPGELLPRDIVREGFLLDEEQYFTEEFPLPGGYGVIVLDAVTPSRIPELESVREAVVADFVEMSRFELLEERGMALQESVRQGLEDDSNLEELATQAGAEFRSFESFTLGTLPPGLPRNLMERLFEMAPGETSSFLLDGEAGHIVVLRERLVPAVNPESAQVRMTRENLARFSAMVTGQSLLEELIENQERALEAARTRR